ncbi:importin-beta N-terminal domain-containing protein [Babesia ovata]|uniref:Importin-beta N-terminal domain-containing protein n=1 Tax=Babesia ovata TaxID=189622 RepID=A0A2H6KER8_9APIC|nr:importin-beta N-terminal domain-containing protein [Babesia ovata]GBE61491.1 importin-beta N-terminal domain-containing protein [Babesia ovata]
MMADAEFTASLVTLCRQTLSGDRATISAAEENLKALLQPNGAHIGHRVKCLFRIILLPSTLILQPTAIADNDLKVVSPELQLWVAICLKNFIRSNFDTPESHGGVSDDLRHLLRCFLVVAVLNHSRLGLDKNVFRQLEETLHMLSEYDFPHNMDFAMLFMEYCHLSDVAPTVVANAFSQRVHKAASMRTQVNVGINSAVENSQSLARSLEEAKSTVHLAYGESCAKLVASYSQVHQSLESYSAAMAVGDLGILGRVYCELFRTIASSCDAMCEVLKGVTLCDLDLGKFLQAAAYLFPKEQLLIHAISNSTGTCEVKHDKGDALMYFDDRVLYKDPALWQMSSAALPEIGNHGQWVIVSLRAGSVLNEATVDLEYFRRKTQTLGVFKRLMKKYKTSLYGDAILSELKIVLTVSENMLLYVFKVCLSKLREFLPKASVAGAPNCMSRVVLDILEAITYITKILTYIHAIDLPECCEDNVDVYLGGMLELLRFSDPVILQVDQSGIIRKMKVAICKLMRYYGERYQEAFCPFVFQCIDDTVALCRGLSQQSDDDRLCSAILEFLTASASTHWNPHGGRNSPFTDADYLADMIRSIVLPNIGFRECDLFLMEDCPLEFVQRELDTGTGHSRRFAAISLLKKLVNTYGQIVQYILNQFALNVSSVNDYKLKELYLQLIICSNFKANDGFQVHAYFSEHLRGDLLRESQSLINEQANVLIVMAIMKFLFTFKKQIPVNELSSLVAPISAFLRHQNDAVRFLAAETLNRILPLVRDYKAQLKQTLLQALGCILQLMRSEPPNEFYVRCVMRIFLFLRQDVLESGFVMLDIIVELIKKASDNPVNPVFNHYLFECLATLLRIHLSAGSMDAVARIEDGLIPTIAIIMQQDMHPFVPYGLQILHILLRATQQPGSTYMQLFSHLTCIDTWRASTANAHGAAKLLVCYFERHALFEKEIVANIERILGVFHFCLTHRKLSLVALDLLNGLVRYLPVAFYSKFITSIVTVMLSFIHKTKTGESIPRVVTSMALLATSLHLQQYAPGFVETLETIQAGICRNFFQVVYVPNAQKVLALESKRVLMVGTAIMLASPVVQVSGDIFTQLANFLGELIQGQSLKAAPNPVEHDEMEDLMQDLEFDVSFVRLRSVEDPANRGGAKLLDPSVNVEHMVRSSLRPIASIIQQLPPGGSAHTLLNLLN